MLGVLLVVGGIAAVVALVALVPVDRLVSTRRRAVVRGLVGAAALVVVVGIVGLVASVGNPFTWAGDQLGSSGEVANGSTPSRQSRDEQPHRLVGRGLAGVPRPSRRRHGRAARSRSRASAFRDNAQNVTEPHSLPLQLLSDSGLPGLALGIVLVDRARARDPRERAEARPGRARGGGGAARASARVRPPRARRLRPRLPRDRRRRQPSSRRRSSPRAGPAPSRAAGAHRRQRLARGRCRGVGARGAGALVTRGRPGLPSGRCGRPRGGGRLGAAGAEPQPALARAALRPRHDRVPRGGQSRLRRRSTSRRPGYSPRIPRPGTSSVSFARPRSATSAAPTSPSMPRSRSIRRAASSTPGGRARSGAGRRERS